MKWEYKAIPVEGGCAGDTLVLAMDAMGLKGWELVNVAEEYAYFKRPLLASPKSNQCPDCGEVARFTDSNILTSCPPQRRAACVSCGWKGLLTVGPHPSTKDYAGMRLTESNTLVPL
jgi:hypothetical protein